MAAADKFFFHSKSAVAAPGRGANEALASEEKYETLVKNPHWRRALSNFWVSPFTLNGHRWNTVEHYFQAQKLYIPSGPEQDHTRNTEMVPFTGTFQYPMFCLDVEFASWTPPPTVILSQEAFNRMHATASADGSAAQKLRKCIKLTPSELALWDSRKEDVMARAQFAKFNQNPTLRGILLATGDAELWHGAARQPPARMMSLERVRAALRAGLTELPGDESDDD